MDNKGYMKCILYVFRNGHANYASPGMPTAAGPGMPTLAGQRRPMLAGPGMPLMAGPRVPALTGPEMAGPKMPTQTSFQPIANFVNFLMYFLFGY